MVLIIGIGGLIGKNLFRFFHEPHDGVRGTTHTIERTEEGSIYHFDLLDPDFGFLPGIESGLTHAIVCSGETRFDECKRDGARSRRINVTNMIRLFDRLWESNLVPVFLSSDAVFDGQRGGYSEEEECHPKTVYGSQKLEAENHLRSSGKPWLILRLSKIYDVKYRDGTLITHCVDSLRSGKPIRSAVDQFIAPVYVEDVCRAADLLIRKNKNGIFHVSYPQVISRYELSTQISEYFGFNFNLVQSCHIADFDFIESRASHYNMNSGKLQSLGFEFTRLEKTFQMIAQNYAGH